MISIIIFLVILTLLFGIAFKITGALLAAVIWLCIKLPITLILFGLGIILCCTIIFIPIGIGCLKGGLKMLIPGCVI